MDIQLITKSLADAKELVAGVLEDMTRARQAQNQQP